jgi:Ni/Co efflux regulator RcnB
MSRLLSTLLAAVFAAVTITPVAFAADKSDDAKKEMKKSDTKKTDAKKTDSKKKAKKNEDKK